MRKMSFLLAMAAGCISQSAFSTVLLDEPFDYRNGAIVDNSGGNWTNFGVLAQPIAVTNNVIAGLAHGSYLVLE
jgi:hypothetical protein